MLSVGEVGAPRGDANAQIQAAPVHNSIALGYAAPAAHAPATPQRTSKRRAVASDAVDLTQEEEPGVKQVLSRRVRRPNVRTMDLG